MQAVTGISSLSSRSWHVSHARPASEAIPMTPTLSRENNYTEHLQRFSLPDGVQISLFHPARPLGDVWTTPFPSWMASPCSVCVLPTPCRRACSCLSLQRQFLHTATRSHMLNAEVSTDFSGSFCKLES